MAESQLIMFILMTYSTLGNAIDSIVISSTSTIIDSVIYDNGAAFPDVKGYSLTLDPSSADSTANDSGGNWCNASTLNGSGDYGTAGDVNDSCE